MRLSEHSHTHRKQYSESLNTHAHYADKILVALFTLSLLRENERQRKRQEWAEGGVNQSSTRCVSIKILLPLTQLPTKYSHTYTHSYSYILPARGTLEEGEELEEP